MRLYKPSSSPPLAVLFLGVLAVSTAALFIRLGQQHASSLVVAAYRLGFATLVLLPFTLFRHRREINRLSAGRLLWLLLAGFLLAMHFVSWFTSLEYTSVASSVVLVTTTPLWVALLSPLVLREQPPPAVWIGLVVALTGGAMVGAAEGCSIGANGLNCGDFSSFLHGRAMTGNLLALVGAWFAAGYLLAGRRLRMSLSLGAYVFLVYGAAAVLLLVAVAVRGERLIGYPPQAYGWLLALALLPQLVGHTSLNWALRHVSAAYVSVALLGEPIGSAVLAFVFLRETPGSFELLGGALILIGIYLVSLGEHRNAAQTAATSSGAPVQS